MSARAWRYGVLVVALLACSEQVESPAPVIEPPSSDAEPPPVDPEIICRDQRVSRVTLHGSSFAPAPIGLPGDPKLALPTIQLARAHELDGEEVRNPDQVVYSGDPEADPSNAVDDGGELIEVDGAPLLSWQSQEEMSFLVTQDLVLGTLEQALRRENGPLPVGVWDVTVKNPGGQSAQSIGALAVIAAPEVEALAPEIVCLEQGARTLVLSGRSFLRNEREPPQLAVDGVERRFDAALSDCTAIAHEGLDAEVCETATVELAEGSIPAGYPVLTLENPESAACQSEELVQLRVVAAPVVDRVVEPLACIAQRERTFVIEGESFLRLDETTTPTVTVGDLEVDIESMDCEPMALPAGSRSVELCTSITFALLGGDLDPGLYDVSVVNPDDPSAADNGGPTGCASTLADAVRITAPPAIDVIEPSYVCLADGSREVTITGSDFLVVDGVAPAVEIGEVELASASVVPSGCEADALDVAGISVQRCSTLVVTLDANADYATDPDVLVVNPEPAGCRDSVAEGFSIVPRPSIESVTPQPLCNDQGEHTFVITGSDFFALDGVAPEVAIGSVVASAVEATEASCDGISGRAGAQLCTELVVTLEEGTIAAGVHDVVVTNTAPAGCASEDTATLAIVDAPSIGAVAPNPICLGQGDVDVTITGASFVRIGAEQPIVTVGEGASAVAAVEVAVTEASCSPVAGTDAVVCTELIATLAMDALAIDTVHRVTVENPGAAACVSQQPIDLMVVAPPEIAAIDTATVCTGGGTITITGVNLTGVTGRLIDPDTQGVVDAVNTVVSEDGTSATITFGSGVTPDTYQLQVAGTHGCADIASQQVTAAIGPVAFFMEPPVAYNGVALRGTLYASGVGSAPASVTLVPAGGGTAGDEEPLSNVVWPSAGSGNKIGATIPEGLDEGAYDVMVDFPGSCDSVLPNGLVVEADVTLALQTPALAPQFGEQNMSVALSVLAEAEADLQAGEVNFEATPRAYLSSAALATAEPLRATQFDSEERLTAIVPDTLPAGTYDLVVVNPDGSVGFQAGAYEATSVAPPVIDSVAPTQLDNDMNRPITISGGNFFNPTTDLEVTLECLANGSSGPTLVGPLAIDNASTSTSLIATVTASSLAHGTICVVRVTNTTNGTFDELSAIAITNKASKLPVFQQGSALVEARRAPATAFGSVTREARFLYAIGGDDRDVTSAKATVEAAPIGRFGALGAWRTVSSVLPEGVTQAQAIGGGRYVYLFGGLAAGAPTTAIQRAAVLRPEDAPLIANVDLRFFGGAIDGDPDTREGLAPGALTYVIAAVFAAADTDNPGGESLPSEPLTLYVPDVPDGVEVELTWSAVLGADGVTEASSYRIYRTATPDSPITSLALLAEVAAPTHSFIDRNPAAFLDPGKAPLVLGDLGAWRELPATLNTPRAAYGMALARDPSCASYLYIVGGRTGAATESATYEYATFNAATGALGALTQATGTGLGARREHAVFVADGDSSAFINPAMGTCESYLYASSGFSGATSFVTTIQDAPVQAGGALGAFTTALTTGSSPQQFAGHAGFFSSDGAYVMAGASSTTAPPAATNIAQQADMNGASVPNVGNFSSTSNVLLQARYLPGFARDGAFFYLVGGASTAGTALSSTERNVR